MAIPKPGKPVRGSTTGAPIMALFDLLGRRWAMGIVWNLAAGPVTFRALQALRGRKSGTISPSILSARMKDLQEARLVERTPRRLRVDRTGSGVVYPHRAPGGLFPEMGEGPR